MILSVPAAKLETDASLGTCPRIRSKNEIVFTRVMCNCPLTNSEVRSECYSYIRFFGPVFAQTPLSARRLAPGGPNQRTACLFRLLSCGMLKGEYENNLFAGPLRRPPSILGVPKRGYVDELSAT